MAKRKAKKLRVAFIGAGGIAGTHMRYYDDMDDVDMVAMADISENGMARWAERYGIPDAFTDYNDMLVSVCHAMGLTDTQSFENWRDGGELDAVQRANAKWKEMLADYEAPPLDQAIDEALQAFMAKRKEAMPDIWA